ncbi:unnamed protein product [Kuraishia capsulata CBS 1993]|uniref:Mitochondrial import inner membrane translocase subunit n=1 Tax=Kuraishia capsulata CBS 1993 TaxID=1382522 RepID=W6MIB5_9ASCO|nr:uncharacterized protein KUCA_T00002160001 [Kuraishia capsulata CBS 1993]CDK26189.1 unnamed protein product [Kuraishia capsulata CBS 1993]
MLSVFESFNIREEASYHLLTGNCASNKEMDNNQIKKQLQDTIVREIATANVNELVNRLTENCFELCFTNPSSSMGSKDKKCIEQCMQKYMKSWNILSQSYVKRIQEAKAAGDI